MENENKKSKKPIIHVVGYSVLILIILALLIDRGVQKSKMNELQLEFNKTASDKAEASNQLQQMLTTYQNLKTNNDNINGQLAAEQAKIKRLIAELQNVKYSSKKEIEEYKAEIENMRGIMRHYIGQIDSLNTLNQDLIAENKQVKNDMRSTRNENKTLQDQNQNLSGKVEKASMLKGTKFDMRGLTARDGETNRVKKVDKIKVCFTLQENEFAKAGPRTIYLRIVRPDGFVVTESANDLFKYQGKEIAFSGRKEIDYESKTQDICVYAKFPANDKDGEYTAVVYLDSYQIGETKISFK